MGESTPQQSSRIISKALESGMNSQSPRLQSKMEQQKDSTALSWKPQDPCCWMQSYHRQTYQLSLIWSHPPVHNLYWSYVVHNLYYPYGDLTQNGLSWLASLPQAFWAEAVSTAAYMRNRSPTSALENMTPHQAWYGQ